MAPVATVLVVHGQALQPLGGVGPTAGDSEALPAGCGLGEGSSGAGLDGGMQLP